MKSVTEQSTVMVADNVSQGSVGTMEDLQKLRSRRTRHPEIKQLSTNVIHGLLSGEIPCYKWEMKSPEEAKKLSSAVGNFLRRKNIVEGLMATSLDKVCYVVKEVEA